MSKAAHLNLLVQGGQLY